MGLIPHPSTLLHPPFHKIVALKQVKFDDAVSKKVGFPMAALREINVLLDLAHTNIVRVSEMVMGGNASKIFMVMEYMECDLKQAVGGEIGWGWEWDCGRGGGGGGAC